MATKPTDLLGMSDEDFANMNGPPEVEATATTQTTETVTDTEAKAEGETVTEEEKVETEAETIGEGGEGEALDTEKQDGESEGEKTDTEATGTEAKADETKAGEKVEDKKPGEGEEAKAETPDYEGFYKSLIETPIKANGKDIKLNNKDEIVALVQQGINYTRKMQEMAPVRKLMLMLQNNGLLDQDKLSFYIDLDKKDPKAIQKFLKDSNIDPMDIDITSESDYTPGNHQVTDAEVTFDTVLSEVSSTSEGRETIKAINTTWDEESKNSLWSSPEIMTVIHQQRENGIYDAITTEMDRRIALGQIKPGTPFLQAYKTVGDEMAAAALQQQEKQTKEPTVVVTRAAAPKPKVDNGDKASAASVTRAAPKQAEEKKNFLSMSDEEFEKQANVMLGRL